MRAISLWQPWATLIAIGAKRIETRCWDAKYTGPLAIHASKKRMGADEACMLWNSGITSPMNAILSTTQFPFGSVIAVCNLDLVTSIVGGNGVGMLGTGAIVGGLEYKFGNYEAGRFAWMLSGIKQLKNPIPWKGRQKFFDVPDELIERALKGAA